MKIKSTKKFWLKAAAGLFGVLIVYWGLICFPQPFFRSSVSANNLTLYSDQPFSPEAGKQILEIVEAKLAASPLYSADDAGISPLGALGAHIAGPAAPEPERPGFTGGGGEFGGGGASGQY